MVQVQVTFSVSLAPFGMPVNVARLYMFELAGPAVAPANTPAAVRVAVATPAAQSPTSVTTFAARVLEVRAERADSAPRTVSPAAGAVAPVPTAMWVGL